MKFKIRILASKYKNAKKGYTDNLNIILQSTW
jgi:hypothetical protein